MKVVGIIAEYNPFHNGHAYHIEEVRKKTDADYIIAIMSGNFVQRGGPAIIDKYTRTKMALLGGVDLVIELPVVAATASAETFARCGVAILDSLGVVTHLGFGCETDNLELLNQLATLFAEEPAEYRELLSSYLREGISYPVARARAAGEYLYNVAEFYDTYDRNIIENTLNNPNNILAIEYLKALKQIGSSIEPCPILRQGSGYHDKRLSGPFSSATAIRSRIMSFDVYQTDMLTYNAMVPEGMEEDMDPEYESFYRFLKCQMPIPCVEAFTDAFKSARPITEDDFSSLLQYKLYLENGNFHDYADVKDDLANRILNMREYYTSFSCFIDDVKTRNMTYTAISRGLLHILLDIKKSDIETLAQLSYAPYVRILGFRKASSLLLNELKKSSIPVVAQLARDHKKLSESALQLLNLDISSAHIYNVIKEEKSAPNSFRNEYRTPLIYV